MNENKVALILKIARELTDVQCEMILHRIESNPTLLANKLVKCANEWDESEHPRDENGMFVSSSSGAASDNYTQKEAEQWSKAGHKIPKSKEITQKKHEIEKVKKDLEKFGHNEDIRKFDEEKLVKLQRELAEMIRDAKMEKRIGIEQKHDERIASEKKKKQEMVKRFQDVEDEMDEIEEAYGDRDKGVGFKWPETQEADEARKRYRQLRRERDKLDKMIDWKSLESQE